MTTDAAGLADFESRLIAAFAEGPRSVVPPERGAALGPVETAVSVDSLRDRHPELERFEIVAFSPRALDQGVEPVSYVGAGIWSIPVSLDLPSD